MAAYRATSLESEEFLSMMRTLAGLSEAAELRGDVMSAKILSSVAGLLAQVHVDRVPADVCDRGEVEPCAAAICLA